MSPRNTVVFAFLTLFACTPKPSAEKPVTEPAVEAPKATASIESAKDPVCKSAKDCVILDNDCGDTQVVHKNSEASMMFGSEHGECLPVRAKAMVLQCVDGKCQSQQVGFEKFRDGCANAGDCEVIASLCSSWDVVASSQVEAAKAQVAKDQETVDCAIPDGLPKKPKVLCVNRFCVPGSD